MDFAPIADVNVNPENPAIGRLERSFSDDPQVVAAHAAAYISGLHEGHVLSCIKHFPGHGSAFNDSHLGLTDITATWSTRELVPFQSIIKSGQADAIMTGHLFNAKLDDKYPATLSPAIIDGLLRSNLGWDGVVISDDLQMKAIAAQYTLEETVERSINAGVDILLFGNNLEYRPHIAAEVHGIIKKLVAEGRISPSRIEESYERIMALKQKLKR